MVDARALHEALGVTTPFHKWVSRRVEEYGFEEPEDFRTKMSKTGGRPRTDYLLTIDMAKELAMLERSDIGREVRRYYIRMEQAAIEMANGHMRNGEPEKIPQSLLDAVSRMERAAKRLAPPALLMNGAVGGGRLETRHRPAGPLERGLAPNFKRETS